MWRSRVPASLLLLAALVPAAPARAATLPPHDPLSVIVIGDEVNPHGLTPAELTQPADIKTALEAADSGLRLAGGATLVDSQCVDAALTALAGTPRPDVVIYFAHQPARACSSAADRQPALTAALEQFLQSGGGVVVFHHGLYVATGKDPILQLLGGRASSIAWDTTTGQRVFAVAPSHFIATTGTRYDGTAPLAASGPIPGGTFSYFDNIPDERYPTTQLLTEPAEQREILFASNSGGTRVLAYTLVRPGWSGRVVWYQPAEYQPRALDDRAGVNFQILANSILWAARREPGAPSAGDDVPAVDGPPGAGAPGGCCRAASGDDASGAPLLALALGLAWAVRRRRPATRRQQTRTADTANAPAGASRASAAASSRSSV